MRLLITGATGLIGAEIVHQCLEKGHSVHYLTTSKEKLESEELYQGFYWNPAEGIIDLACLKGVDVIINLAGASIAERWTASYKQTILDSRIQSLKLLKKTLSENKHQIQSVVSASAIGIYPSSLEKAYTENALEISDSFLGEVVKAWENEADAFNDLGLGVAKIRIGIVLAENGGALAQLTKPINYGVGAPVGSGKQWQSWVHIKDVAGIFLHVAVHKLTGVFNAVGNNPVTNKALTKAIANILNKPLWLPNVPTFALKLLLGEMATIVLESQQVLNDKIRQKGYVFEFTNLEHALQSIFNRP